MGYSEFKNLFIEDYWSLQAPKIVRNKIEYGRFNEQGNMSKSE